MGDTLTINKASGAGLVVTADAHIGGKLGVNTTAPSVSLEVVGTDAVRIASGSTAERPTVPQLGQIRYNTTTDQYEGYVECSDGINAAWGSLGGVMDIDGDTYISAEDDTCDDNDELKFFTAGGQRMVIKTDGDIGVGTNNPQHKLDIFGTARVTGVATLPNVSITGGSIEGTAIGANTESSGAFTTLSASSGITVAGQAVMSNVDINGGEIDATPIGANTPSTGVFTSLVSNNAVSSNSLAVTNNATVGGTLGVSGNATFTNITVTGTSTINAMAISGGSIENSTIGATTASTGLFTTIGTSGLATLIVLMLLVEQH